MKLKQLMNFVLMVFLMKGLLLTTVALAQESTKLQSVENKRKYEAAKKAAENKKKSTNTDVSKNRNETKKLYGVTGAELGYVKVANKNQSYEVKGKNHLTIGQEASRNFSQTGVASYYHNMFNGRKTSNGEIYDEEQYTAAHKSLAIGSYALVTNLNNNRKVIVRINDRGPFSKKRILDLSKAAAREIGMIKSGVATVRIEAIQVDSNGYISGKGVESLMKLAKRENLPLKMKAKGDEIAIKADKNLTTPINTETNTKHATKNKEPQFVLKVVQLASEAEAKKIVNKVKTEARIERKGKTFEVIMDKIADKANLNYLKMQVNNQGKYQLFSYAIK